MEADPALLTKQHHRGTLDLSFHLTYHEKVCLGEGFIFLAPLMGRSERPSDFEAKKLLETYYTFPFSKSYSVVLGAILFTV